MKHYCQRNEIIWDANQMERSTDMEPTEWGLSSPFFLIIIQTIKTNDKIVKSGKIVPVHTMKVRGGGGVDI